MIDKFRRIAIKAIGLALLLIMIMPNGVFAGTYTVNNWAEYKEKLKNDIMNQETSITINFNTGDSFTSEYLARIKIENEFEEALGSTPYHLGELNITNKTIVPVLDGTTKVLKGATHQIEYKYTKKNFNTLGTNLNEQYNIIKTKFTDYEKMKHAYDYIVGALSDVEGKEVPEIKTIFSHKVDEEDNLDKNSYAILFAMMMNDLRYDNDFAIGKGGIWNIVKVQGKWYHVDGRLETIEDNVVKDKCFLILKDESTWNFDEHYEGKVFADKQYEGNNPTVPQLIYEIELIKEDIDKTINDIKNISEDISMDKIKESKQKLITIEEKKNNYVELKEILKIEVEKYPDEEALNTAFGKLEEKIKELLTEIIRKKEKIVIKAVTKAENTFQMNDILAAKESITMIVNKGLEERINALEVAVAAIEKAERTKLEEDITLTKNAVGNVRQEQRLVLEERIKVLEATIAVEKAERTKLTDDIKNADGLVNILKEGDIRTSLQARLNALRSEIEKNAKEQESINEAIKAVEDAENALKSSEISVIEAKNEVAITAIGKINTESVQKQLQGRIDNIQIAVDAIKSVNDAKDRVKDIQVEGPLEGIINEAEAAVKAAEVKVKIIKDAVVRSEQQSRTNAIKDVIAAIKAVDKAETPPFKATYVTSAKNAIKKINQVEYVNVISILNNRLNTVESMIAISDIVTKAITAVEKAEKSMKDIDIALARDAITVLAEATNKDEVISLIGELTNRIDAIVKMNEVESNLIKYLNESTSENKSKIETAIKNANNAIEKLNNSTIKTQHGSRMMVIEKAKYAIEVIENVKSGGTIDEAESAIANISDSKIKKELENKLYNIEAQQAVEAAEISLKDKDTQSYQNTAVVNIAEEKVKVLPTGDVKKDLQAIIKELNNAIKAKQAVENAEVKFENGTLTVKDVLSAEKAILNINPEYILGLKARVDALIVALEKKEATELLFKAKEAVDKAIETKLAKDITAAKKAISFVKDGEEKTKLNMLIVELEYSIAENTLRHAEEGALHNSKTLSKDITAAKNAVAAISNKADYVDEILNLNDRIRALESYVATIKVLENAEKTRNDINTNAAKAALGDFKLVAERVKEKDNDRYQAVYVDMINYIDSKIKSIEDYLSDEAKKVTDAENKVEEAEGKMKIDSDPDNVLIQDAQRLVNMVTDKNIRIELQQRIDAIKIAKDAKAAVARAEVYPTEKSVKDAETVLNKVDDRYRDIIEHLGKIIANLKNQLDISKKVAEATKLVQKAVETRIAADSIKARFAVDALKELAEDSYNRLKDILDDLDDSINNEAGNESQALVDAQDALTEMFKIIDDVNTYITQIIEGEDKEADKIIKAYEKIESAKNQVIKANAAVRKLKEQKNLLAQIDYANKEIDLAEDKIDVKEAVRLVTIASTSVNNAKTEDDKSKARLDIAAARRAIDRIGHNNNKALKATILNNMNAIEGKLATDNDQELIDAAVVAVNTAADILSKAVKENKVLDVQEQIDKAIFSAKMAIGWISDNNKAAKNTLTGFINDIEIMFKAEKEGILNEERIKNAEKAVVEAESKKGSDELESYIRSARLRVKIIKNDGPETAAKIEELNARLDILEGKGSGSPGGGSGGGGNNKPGTGGNKPGGSNSGGNKVPITPLPEDKRFIGITEPEWGKTKELKKTIPTTGFSIEDMMAFRIYESKLKVIELSNILQNAKNVNALLVVRGKNINLDSKPYIHDNVNNSILVPAKILGDELGFGISLVDNPAVYGTKRLLLNGIVNGEIKSIIMDLGSEYCYVNGNLVNLRSKPVMQEGRTYIPVDFMVEHLGLNFSYYNESGNIQLLIN